MGFFYLYNFSLTRSKLILLIVLQAVVIKQPLLNCSIHAKTCAGYKTWLCNHQQS